MQASLFLLVVLLSVSLCLVLILLGDQQSRLRAARRLRLQPTTAQSIALLLYGKDERLKSFQNVAEAGMHAAAAYRGRLVERLSCGEWVNGSIERAFGREQRNLEKHVAILPVLGVLAPAVAIFIVLTILSSCVSRYTEIAVLQPMEKSAAMLRHSLTHQHAEGSTNNTGKHDEEGAIDFSRSQTSAAAVPSGERLEPDYAAWLDYKVDLSEIYLWLGQAFTVLMVGVFAFVSAFGGYLTIVGRNRALEGYLRDFADEVMGLLLTSSHLPQTGPGVVDEATVVRVV